MTYGEFSPPPPKKNNNSSAYLEGNGERGGGVDFRGYAAFAKQRRVVDASHVEDDGAERLN